MRVIEMTVGNYRSIGVQTRFELSNLTTLIGPNNEGKSNLLRALALGLRVIEAWSTLPSEFTQSGELSGRETTLIYGPYAAQRRGDRNRDIDYDWRTDYPLAKQEARSVRPTLIRLTFKLDEDERQSFKQSMGFNTNGDLPVELRFSRASTSLRIVKQGAGASSYKNKAGEIARFITERISYVLIPAVRTMEQATSLLNELASIRLSELANSPEYQSAIQQVNELRDAAVKGVQEDLQASISTYLPSVSSVAVHTRDVRQASAINRVVIDDGSPTPLEQKGDGVKSLFALALIQHLARERTTERGDDLILLVDEPEAHLHSRAVHDLQTLFTKISRTQQVVLATHNAIFVNREHVNANILVQRNSASPAGSVKRVREVLGIEPQDNLDAAEVVVLTEGWTDARILAAALRTLSPRVSRDLESGRVFFKSTTGSGKMRSHILRERSNACRLVIVLDDDASGNQEATTLRTEGVVDARSIFILRAGPKRNSEIEDLIEPDVYLHALNERFGRNFAASSFANASRKWSDNFKAASANLAVAGDPVENLKTAKMAVCEAVEAHGQQVFRTIAIPGLQALHDSIWPAEA